MANFTARFTDGATIAQWDDPAFGGVPTRQNAFEEHPHLRFVAAVGVEVEVSATIIATGIEGPADAALGGRLFTLSFAELPGISPPSISQTPAVSSVQRFTPPAAGHYTLKMKRLERGAVYLHIDAL